MKITERLKVEHGVFLHQLKALERLVREDAAADAVGAVVAVIASAEEHHSELEDRILYPAIEKVLGKDSPPLRAVAAEHVALRGLAERIQGGDRTAALVLAYVEALRKHLEREIHALFPLAEEVLSPEALATLSNWDVEHVHDEAGRPRWVEKRPG
jgi:hemerythrin-like domain-containing protein